MTQDRELQELMDRKRADLAERMGALKSELGIVERELAAIDAYRRVASGQPAPIPATPQTARPAQSRSRGRRPEEGGIRDQVAKALSQFGMMGRSEILEKIGKAGDETAAIAVSNALVKLRSMGIIERDDATKKYRYLFADGSNSIPPGSSDQS